MRLTPIYTLLIFSLLVFTVSSCRETNNVQYHVSITGNDTNDGSIDSPFKSIKRAIIETRKTNGEKTILIHPGKYYNVNIKLTNKDNSLVIKAGSEVAPTLFGGVKFTDFKTEDKFIYAEVPNTRNREWDFRMIQVNGNYQERARFPEKGAFTHLNVFDVRWLSSEAGGWERKPTQTEKTTLKYIPEDLNPEIDINNAELTIYHEWDETLVGLKEHDKKNHILKFDNESQHPPGAFAKRNKNAQTYVVWNTKEGMLKPGQWYLDRTRERLYYWPEKGEDISKLEVVVPKHQNIISLEPNTKNITIEGLNLSSTTTKLITGGYGANRFEGAISGKKVSDISLKNVTIKNVGGWGIRLNGDNISVKESEIYNCGAGAISFRANNFRIKNNKLHDIGLVYMSAVGIIGGGNNNTISYNEIYNMPYCGINGLGNNSLVEGNVIHNIKTFMQDGGAIYMFGHKNTIVKDNVVLSKLESGINVYAYYLDEGCENCVVENNLSYNAAVPVQAHMTRNCTYKNNVFLDKGLQSIAYANSSDMTFEKNVLVANSIIFKGPTNTSPEHIKGELGKVMKGYSSAIGITSWKNNIFNSDSKSIRLRQLAQYDAVAEDELTPIEGTIFSNVELKGIETGQLNLTTDSIVKSQGIQLKDFSKAGYKTNLTELINYYY
ncbi:right-handed parallel beta-helix repeat-containing protein [uncultured Lutibacter sp.]|uniref:right-handed parallel beta-helix repeat-containing protein n=1 Tax=uncultured Lutibacter sp. TaxID=437739 RepID=UPI002620E305|nr:right-handed parallel beta-helix repeat-containing protein [uncultured Lutibacter sp.]